LYSVGWVSTIIDERMQSSLRSVVMCSLMSIARAGFVTRSLEFTDPAAVCIDGSPAMYWQRLNPHSSKWLVFFEGGGSCNSHEQCAGRLNLSEYGMVQGYFASSTSIEMDFYNEVGLPFGEFGVLSNNTFLNPYFAEFNVAVVHNCDGGFFNGGATFELTNVTYFLHGKRIRDAAIRSLLNEGMAYATDILFAGASSGGVSVLMNVEDMRSLLPVFVNVAAMVDGGFFPVMPNLNQTFTSHNMQTANPLCFLNPQSDCILPTNAVRFISVPYFIYQSFNDPLSRFFAQVNTSNVSELEAFTSAFIDTLEAVPESYFLTSCEVHSFTVYTNAYWTGMFVDGVLAREASETWHQGLVHNPFES
jgi:hypothetical protein